jgi:serine/threonine protein kinase
LFEDGTVQSNVAVGTPDYISPEILRVSENTLQSDKIVNLFYLLKVNSLGFVKTEFLSSIHMFLIISELCKLYAQEEFFSIPIYFEVICY